MLLGVSLSFASPASAAALDDFLTYTPIYRFQLIAIDTDNNSYAFDVPVGFDGMEETLIAMPESNGVLYASCYYVTDSTTGILSLVYSFDFSYLGDGVEIKTIQLDTTTSRLVDSVQNTICFWEIKNSSWSGRAFTDFVYNAFTENESTVDSNWIFDTEVRSYDNSNGIGRLTFSPVRPAFVTSASVFIDCAAPITEMALGVPVVDPRDPYPTITTMIDKWDFYAVKQVIVESTGLPPVLDWFYDMAKDILGLQLLPGITIGGLIAAFIAIPLVVAFLKLFAGG